MWYSIPQQHPANFRSNDDSSTTTMYNFTKRPIIKTYLPRLIPQFYWVKPLMPAKLVMGPFSKDEIWVRGRIAWQQKKNTPATPPVTLRFVQSHVPVKKFDEVESKPLKIIARYTPVQAPTPQLTATRLAPLLTAIVLTGATKFTPCVEINLRQQTSIEIFSGAHWKFDTRSWGAQSGRVTLRSRLGLQIFWKDSDVRTWSMITPNFLIPVAVLPYQDILSKCQRES